MSFGPDAAAAAWSGVAPVNIASAKKTPPFACLAIIDLSSFMVIVMLPAGSAPAPPAVVVPLIPVSPAGAGWPAPCAVCPVAFAMVTMNSPLMLLTGIATRALTWSMAALAAIGVNVGERSN